MEQEPKIEKKDEPLAEVGPVTSELTEPETERQNLESVKNNIKGISHSLSVLSRFIENSGKILYDDETRVLNEKLASSFQELKDAVKYLETKK